MSVRSVQADRVRGERGQPARVEGDVGVDVVKPRRPRAASRRLRVNALRLVVAVVWLGSWELTTRIGLVDKFFFGQPSGVADRMWSWLTQGTALGPLWEQVAVTMEETVLGFLVGSVLGIVAGVLLGSNRLLADVFAPYIKALNSIPRVVLGALFAISLGLDLKSKVATAAVLVFFVVFFNAFQGVREVDRNLVANARLLGAGQRRVSMEVVLPSALSWIIASLHISFGLALVGAIVGELYGATAGVGELIYYAKNNFDANGVFAGMALLAIVALVAESVITALENRLIRWRPNPVTDVAI